jgi:ABC-2 type transport system permease protein
MNGSENSFLKMLVPTMFNGILATFRHELRLLLFSPLSYLFQLAFLATLSAFIFLVADFYASDEASIRPMLTFLPWVSLILVPALAMRTWVDDISDRSMELTITLPIHTCAVVIGKFLAGYTILLVTLLFTLPIVGTVYYLGVPDPGVLFSGYFASALLLATYYAISLFAASVAREPVGAFIIGIMFLFFLLLLGWDVFGRFLNGYIDNSIIEMLSNFSPKTWLDHLSRGIIDFPGIFYFVSVSATALIGTTWICNARSQDLFSKKRFLKGSLITMVFFLVPAILITLSKEVPGEWDLTAENEFTLHAGSYQILDRLNLGTRVTLYWSSSEPSVPATIKSHADRAQQMLKRLARQSSGKLILKIIDPKPDSDAELRAISSGAKKIPMSSGDSFFLSISVEQGSKKGSIPYLDIRRDQHLEYDIAVVLNSLGRPVTPKIGIVSPLIPSEAANKERRGMSFLSELKNAYDIAVIPYFKTALPDNLDVLVLIDVTILRKEMLYAIDQFVMKGGSLVVMLDPYLRSNQNSNKVNSDPTEDINDISDILMKYGVRYLGRGVVGDDLFSSIVADKRQARLSYPFWMRIRGDALSQSHPTTANLNELFLVEAGSLELKNPEKSLALITTSENSGTLSRKHFLTKKPRELALSFASDSRERIIAAFLRGPFESAYQKTDPEASVTHLESSQDAPTIFVIADIDWLFDPFSLQTTNIGGRVMVRPLNDNTTFLLNMIEYASGEQSLIEIRSRGKIQRPFTRVTALFQSAEKEFKEQELAMAKKVSEIENRMKRYSGSIAGSNSGRLPNDVKESLIKFRQELLPARRELRMVRRKIRDQVDSLGQRLVFINLLCGPLAVLILAGTVYIIRRRRKF